MLFIGLGFLISIFSLQNAITSIALAIPWIQLLILRKDIQLIPGIQEINRYRKTAFFGFLFYIVVFCIVAVFSDNIPFFIFGTFLHILFITFYVFSLPKKKFIDDLIKNLITAGALQKEENEKILSIKSFLNTRNQ